VRGSGKIFVLAFALFALGAKGVASAGVAPLGPAPALELTATDGSKIKLADLHGLVVLLDIWASWCGPCKSSFPSLESLYEELRPRGLEVLAVNVDESRRDAEAFLLRHPHRMRVLLDPKGQVPQMLGAEAMPSSFVIDRRGNIRFRHSGFTETTLESYRREIQDLLAEEAQDEGVVVKAGQD
jgi:thiol-disulfide isomerase/thioredoxin